MRSSDTPESMETPVTCYFKDKSLLQLKGHTASVAKLYSLKTSLDNLSN